MTGYGAKEDHTASEVQPPSVLVVCVCVCVCVRNLNPGSCGPPMVSALSKWWLAFKVGVTAAFLRCFGQGKMADQLQYGHAFFKEVRTCSHL